MSVVFFVLVNFFIRPSNYGMALSVCLSVRLSVRPQLLVNAISWKPLVGLTSHFDMTLIPLTPRTLLIWGILLKTKMAATAVWRLTLYPMQDIACERDILKTACQIDFTFWYGLNTTKTWDAIDFGHSTKTKMAATAVWRLTLYPMQDISCECGSLKNRLSDWLHILIRPYFQVVNVIPCKCICRAYNATLSVALVTSSLAPLFRTSDWLKILCECSFGSPLPSFVKKDTTYIFYIIMDIFCSIFGQFSENNLV